MPSIYQPDAKSISVNTCGAIRMPKQQAAISEDWHRADIIAAIHKSGSTVVALSRRAGLSDSSLSNVFYRSWPRGEMIIATHLGVPPWTIWPSRYPNETCADEMRQD